MRVTRLAYFVLLGMLSWIKDYGLLRIVVLRLRSQFSMHDATMIDGLTQKTLIAGPLLTLNHRLADNSSLQTPVAVGSRIRQLLLVPNDRPSMPVVGMFRWSPLK